MHFGEVLDEERYKKCIRVAYDSGIRTFVTADVYGQGKADAVLGEVLSEFPRESYCLVGMLGHDFIDGEREGSKGYPRFTSPSLRVNLVIVIFCVGLARVLSQIAKQATLISSCCTTQTKSATPVKRFGRE